MAYLKSAYLQSSRIESQSFIQAAPTYAFSSTQSVRAQVGLGVSLQTCQECAVTIAGGETLASARCTGAASADADHTSSCRPPSSWQPIKATGVGSQCSLRDTARQIMGPSIRKEHKLAGSQYLLCTRYCSRCLLMENDCTLL